MVKEKNVARFNADVAANEGYLYTRGSLSGRLSNGRISDCVAGLADFKGKRVMDLGCGDGTYTVEFLALGAAAVVGTDAAATAVKAAAKRHKGRKGLSFEALDVYNAKAPRKRYDVMVVRGLLHHLYNVEGAIAALAPLAKTVIVVEPNGYNPVLKLIERTSKYHIEHEEKSYPPASLDRWFEKHGGKVLERRYIGLVPFFCPDWAARFLKVLEPLVERIPLVKQISCAQYVQLIEFPETIHKKGGPMADPLEMPANFSYGVTKRLPANDEMDEIVAEVLINGFAVLPSGFDAAFIEQLKPALDAVYQTQVDEIGGEENLRKIKDADIARALLAYDPIFQKVAACPALLALSKRLLGNGFMLLIQNAIFNRPERENHQKAWHRDLAYQHWTSSDVLALNALFCVDDFTADNGATFVLPGTHQVKEFPSMKFCRKFEQQVIAPAGSFLVLNAMLFHRAGSNRSDKVRRGINHVLGLPFFAQHINIPHLMESRQQAAPEDPALAKYLGYRWGTPESVTEWRKKRMV